MRGHTGLVLLLLTFAGCGRTGRTWNMDEVINRPLNVDIVDTRHKVVDGVPIVVHELYYDSHDADGQLVRVYGFYGYPASAGAGRPVPGIVWSHGGGGRVAPHEVDYFVPKGYAFLTIDLPGKGPGRAESKSTGPDMNDDNLFHMPDTPADIRNTYPYHAALAVMRGVTFLQSRREVWPDNIGLIGWSWGGLVVSLAAQHDDRVAAVAPGVSVAGAFAEREPGMDDEQWRRAQIWRDEMDPLASAGRQTHPTFVVSGSNDNRDNHGRLYDALGVEKRLYIVPNTGHGGGDKATWDTYTWYAQIVHWFDWQLKDGPAMPIVSSVRTARSGDAVTVTVEADAPGGSIAAVEVWYRTQAAEQSDWGGFNWVRVDATPEGRTYQAVIDSSEPIKLYAVVRDSHGAITSSIVVDG